MTLQISDFRFQIALVLAGVCAVVAPRPAAAQLPPTDVTVADTRSNGGLSLTIFAASSLGSGDIPSVLIGVEVAGLTAAPAADAARHLELTYRAESDGTTRGQHSLSVPLSDARTVKRATEQGLRVLTRMSLAPGQYVLRVTTRDTGDGKTASVVHEIEVPNLVAGDVTMGDLVISASKVDGATHADPDDDSLLPLVGQPPTGRRQFSRAEQLEVDTDIYEALRDDGSVGQLSVATSLVTPEGRVVKETVDQGSSDTLPNSVFGYQHYTLLSLGTLTPGSYIVRVTVSLDGVTAAWRAVPITVTP